MRTRLAVAVLFALALPVAAQPFGIVGHDPIVRPATSPRGAIVEFEVVTMGGREDPNPVIHCSPASGSLFRLGPTFVNCVADNKWGDHAERGLYVYVQNITPPVVTVPDRIVVDAEGPEGTVVRYEASAEDEVDGKVPVDCTPPSGTRFPIGVTRVQCQAYDSSYNPGYGVFDVEVRGDDDHGKLTIHVPAGITVEATSSAGAEVRFTVTASGSDDPNPTIHCDHESGATFPLGRTTVTCTASDQFGNHAEDDFDITVADTTPPELMLTDVTAEASGGEADVTYTQLAVDAVDGTVPVTCTPPSGSTFPLGRTTVQCSATDAHQNTANGSFYVNVVDSTPPHIDSVTADPSILTPPNHKLVDVTVTAEASDTNDPMPQCRIALVTANEPIQGPGSGSTDYDWRITGPLTLELRAERSGSGTDRIYTVEVSCSDESGNEAAGSVRVLVPKGTNNDGANGTPTPTKRRAVGRR